jgi:hypothetical protein
MTTEFKPRPFMYFSPSSYKTYRDNRDQFVRQKIIGEKRDPQNHHMAVGSSFDSAIKCHLHNLLNKDEEPLVFEKVFEESVEPHCRELALPDGQTVYEAYKASGAMVDLCRFMSGGLSKPRFESNMTVNILHPNQVGAVPMNGKPDLHFQTSCGLDIILDWKVNGFYSKSGVSPEQGYVRLYPGGASHGTATVKMVNGKFPVNVARGIEESKRDWVEQLAIYGWLLGKNVGDEYIGVIHQVACRPNNIRVAMHSFMIGKQFQLELYESMHKAWYEIQQGIYFDGMDAEQSYQACLNMISGQTSGDPSFDALWSDR